MIGMAHRGRLNVLVNVLGKSPSMLFSEFEGKLEQAATRGSGDVKYHKGFSADLRTTGGNVHVVLAFNPSHLEVVDAVVEGSVRARQEQRGDATGATILPLLIHGDAAFAGQGVVMETLQLSQARGFATGGTLHVVINNQVGFTTSDPEDARSTLYCSDVAKMIEAPIFHVNADDPEAVVFVARLALDYRMKFRKDVVIDLVCYRRHGHNEADEPAATQPLMYQAIRKHATARQIYGQRLEQDGLLAEGQAATMFEDYRRGLEEDRPQARAFAGTSGNKFTVDWSRHIEADLSEKVTTAVDRETHGCAREDAHQAAGGVHAAPARGAHHRRPRAHVRGRAAARLGRGGDDGVRDAPHRRLRHPPDRAGHGARHVLPSPRRAARPGDRQDGHAARARREGQGPVPRHRLDAVRGGRARLRVRIFDDRSVDARHLGGAVRRFRERRAGDHRPVHHVGRGEMGPRLAASRCSCRTATKGRARSTVRRGSSVSCSCPRN